MDISTPSPACHVTPFLLAVGLMKQTARIEPRRPQRVILFIATVCAPPAPIRLGHVIRSLPVHPVAAGRPARTNFGAPFSTKPLRKDQFVVSENARGLRERTSAHPPRPLSPTRDGQARRHRRRAPSPPGSSPDGSTGKPSSAATPSLSSPTLAFRDAARPPESLPLLPPPPRRLRRRRRRTRVFRDARVRST